MKEIAAALAAIDEQMLKLNTARGALLAIDAGLAPIDRSVQTIGIPGPARGDTRPTTKAKRKKSKGGGETEPSKRETRKELAAKQPAAPARVVAPVSATADEKPTTLGGAMKYLAKRFKNPFSMQDLTEALNADLYFATILEEANPSSLYSNLAYVGSQIPELMKQLAKLKTAEAWALGVKLVEQHDGYCDDDIEEAAADSKDPQVRVLGFLFADNDNDPVSYGGDWDKRGVELWKMAGVDLVKGFEAEEKKAQQALPLPTKADPKQKQLLDVPASKPKKIKGMSAVGKARITAAAKARWAKVKAMAKK